VVAVGADIVDIDEVTEAVSRFGDRYISRVFTQAEAELCGDVGALARATWLAQCFAAKEAAFKLLRSLGADLPEPAREVNVLMQGGAVDWRWIEVVRTGSGCLALHLEGAARSAAKAAGVSRVMISVGTSGHQAMAVAMAWPSSTSAGDLAPGSSSGQIVDED
jgi:holo-[acyl-carrier protein] synthase